MLDDLLFTTNAVAPIIAMALIGYYLKRIKIITPAGAKEMNKLVFKLFLPLLLFFNIYNIESFAGIGFGYIAFVCVMVLAVFAVGFVTAVFITKDNKKRGALAQASFRSNYAIIGIPLATSVFGAEGGALATLLSAFTIPLFNILAVVVLCIFSAEGKKRVDFKKIALEIAANPLINAILLGVIAVLIRGWLAGAGVDVSAAEATPIYKIVSQLSSVATPLALIVLGANFEFSKIGSMKREIIAGVTLRCVLAPVIGLSAAFIVGGFSGAEFAAFIAVFGTAVAVSSVPMAQEMNSDSELAGQLVIWTTVCSAFTLFVFIYALRAIGIF